MGDQEVLRLLRVDVHAAGDDHVVAPAGQEQVAVVVEIADVADGYPAVLVARRRGFRRIVEVFEGVPALEIDFARLVRRQLAAVGAHDVHPALYGLADRTRMRQPILGCDQRRPAGFRGGIVLVDDRSPPVNHLLLDLDWTWSGRVDHSPKAGHVIRITNCFREFQHPDEHGRDELRVGHPVALDGVEGALGVELLHHDGGDARGQCAHRPH
ncbi:Uncharacterised protein [Mycobacterium tuberculosis]|uniref:Uncharacterized protein n=1 Tax=Mycobacterium tuberculosis TaxID=1773 RepID=A0A655APD1_MYCTX|nr:Uncharacterised protein [Mycobacterium tuberculosis]